MLSTSAFVAAFDKTTSLLFTSSDLFSTTSDDVFSVAVSSADTFPAPEYIANVVPTKTEATPTVNFLIAKRCCLGSIF